MLTDLLAFLFIGTVMMGAMWLAVPQWEPAPTTAQYQSSLEDLEELSMRGY